jgi:hypothetical protein
MKANIAIFASPDTDLDAASLLVDSLESLYEESLQNRGHQTSVRLQKTKMDTDKVFKILAAYVTRIADDDESIILLAGFNATGQRTIFSKVSLRAIEGSHSGSIKLIAKAVFNAGAYIWQCAEATIPANEKDWTTLGHSTQASFVIMGLKPGVKYFFRFAAITPKGVIDFTAPISKIVL